MKRLIKTALLRSLSLRTQVRLAYALLNNVTASASRDDAHLLEWLFAKVDLQQVLLEDRIRQIKFSGRVIADGAAPGVRPPLQTCLMEDTSPWTQQARIYDANAIPGMISEEEGQYYEYIGRLYRGHGEVIELGPWLGKSTRHIIRGLDKNPEFLGRQLHVFDDFVWRSSWMNRHGDCEQLPDHADFHHLFEKYVHGIRQRLAVTRGKIVDYDGNEDLAQIDGAARRSRSCTSIAVGPCR